MFEELQNKKARDFTMTEQLDIEGSDSCLTDYLLLEDNRAETRTGIILEAIDDNLYRITFRDAGFAVFSDLQLALKHI